MPESITDTAETSVFIHRRMPMNTTNCSPKIAISHFLQTGRNHQSEDLPCQDTVLIRNTEDCLFCGLADGQTGTRYGAEGGHACLEAIADYIDSIGIHDFIHTPFPDELPCMLVQTYRRKLCLWPKPIRQI